MIDVLLALVIATTGIAVIVGLSVAVWKQTTLAGRSTDRTLVGQRELEAMVAAGFGWTGSAGATIALGRRSYSITRAGAVTGPDLRSLTVTVVGADSTPRTLATRISRRRSMPPPP